MSPALCRPSGAHIVSEFSQHSRAGLTNGAPPELADARGDVLCPERRMLFASGIPGHFEVPLDLSSPGGPIFISPARKRWVKVPNEEAPEGRHTSASCRPSGAHIVNELAQGLRAGLTNGAPPE